MSRKWIVGLVALVAVGGTAFAAGTAFSTGTDAGRHYSPVTVDLSKDAGATARAKGGIGGGGKPKKPKLLYLQSDTPTTIDTNALGPYVDLALSGCAKVVNGGVFPRANTDVYVQGSYTAAPNEYHVLIGLDDAAAGTSPRPVIQVDTSLTCLKGVK
jgi:hypothetical protein